MCTTMLSVTLLQHLWLSSASGILRDIAVRMGGFGLFLVAVADSSFLSLPESNDALIAMLSIGSTWKNMLYYVAMTMAGSVIGCLLLYILGRKGGSPLLNRKFSKKAIIRAERLFERYGILTLVVPSMLPPPFPFKLFVLGAGVFRLKLGEFVLAVVIGRLIRYTAWGILAVLYGRQVGAFMERRLPTAGLATIVVFLLVIGGFVVLRRRRHRGDVDEVEDA